MLIVDLRSHSYSRRLISATGHGRGRRSGKPASGDLLIQVPLIRLANPVAQGGAGFPAQLR